MKPPQRAARARFRILGFATLPITIALLGLLLVSVPPADGADVAIPLYGRAGGPRGWSVTPGNETDPGPLLSVDRGDLVTMQLTSEDGVPHIFWIDYNADGLISGGEPVSPEFSGMILYAFDALRSGTFTYWCAIHQPSMRGTWVTNASADSTSPTISAATASPAVQVPGGAVNITAEVTDDVAVTSVSVHIVGPSLDVNQTMAPLAASSFYLNRTFTGVGTYQFTVWARDEAGNFQSRPGSFEIAASPMPPSDAGLWILLGALLAAALLAIGLLVWRRRKPRSEQ